MISPSGVVLFSRPPPCASCRLPRSPLGGVALSLFRVGGVAVLSLGWVLLLLVLWGGVVFPSSSSGWCSSPSVGGAALRGPAFHSFVGVALRFFGGAAFSSIFFGGSGCFLLLGGGAFTSFFFFSSFCCFVRC